MVKIDVSECKNPNYLIIASGSVCPNVLQPTLPKSQPPTGLLFPFARAIEPPKPVTAIP